MIDRTTKLRFRRQFRRRQRQIEDIGSQTEEHLDRHFFRRLGRLYEVRRFLIAWVLLLVLLVGTTVIQTRALGSYFQVVGPQPGGIYSEGIVGTFTNANPLFASSEVDTAVSRLLFSSLMTYSDKNELVGDLAKSLTVDASGKVYTAVLRNDVRWHDNVPLTAADVAFTYGLIQNPDAKSPLFLSWQGIKVAAVDAHTVTFTLPNVFAAFPYSLTNGIIPKHKLSETGAGNLRSALFNTTQPVGSGPFKWNRVEVRGTKAEDREQRVSLVQNPSYYKGQPKLTEFIIRSFLNEGRMTKSFDSGELTAMAGIQDATENEKKDLAVGQYNIPVTGAVMAFFRISQASLQDVAVRRALTWATNQQAILAKLSYPSIIARGPLLRGMIGYDKTLTQLQYSVDQANASLDAAGWARGADGIRSKAGQRLSLVLNTLNIAEYASVANILQKQWRAVGAETTVNSLSQDDLQVAINSRSYDILLYGISMGADADQFAYWHSSQADVLAPRRLNFSGYSSKAADSALEAGRTRLDPNLRAAKYRPFLESWQLDAPAVALYQPRFLYITHGNVFNFNLTSINMPADRYADVQNWMVRTERAAVDQ